MKAFVPDCLVSEEDGKVSVYLLVPVLGIVPVGNHTAVSLSSPWPHPGFSGGQLPTTHRVSAHGFEARWQSAWFARGFPAAWARGEDAAEKARRRRRDGESATARAKAKAPRSNLARTQLGAGCVAGSRSPNLHADGFRVDEGVIA